MLSQEQANELVCELLECGVLDLDLIKDTAYTMGQLLDHVNDLGLENKNDMDINSLCYAMFDLALIDVQSAIEEKLEVFQEELESGDLSGVERQAYQQALDANLDIQEDTESYHNFIDTSIYFVNNSEIYRDLFQDELDMFEKLTGFHID